MALPLGGGRSDAAALEQAQESLQDALAVERVRAGDAEAYAELVARHMRRAFAIAYRVLEQREDAEDVVQDAFIRALERLDSLEHGRPFRPWFYRIVLNQALNQRRARGVRATEPVAEHTASTAAGPDRQTERALLRERLRRELNALPETQRTVVILADLEDMSSTEIGEVLEMAAGTVRWHLHQARRALRGALEELKEDG